MRQHLSVLATLAVAGSIGGAVLLTGRGMNALSARPARLSHVEPAPPDPLDLGTALSHAPGCRNVQTTRDGVKIFASFESRDALLKWYRDDLHERMADTSFTDEQFDQLVGAVPQRGGPILAVITFTRQGRLRFETPRPMQVALGVEYYEPASVGVTLGQQRLQRESEDPLHARAIVAQ